MLVGAGGHAKVVLSILRADPRIAVTGVVAPNGNPTIGGLPVLGTDEDLDELRRAGVEAAFIAVGDNMRRAELFRKTSDLGFSMVTAIHPRATIDPSAQIGRGVAIMAGAVINCDAWVGDAAIINTGATVDHDCRIGNAVHIAPGSHLSGYVTIGDGVLVGVGATVGRGRPLVVGEGSVVGAGAVVLHDLPPMVTAAGLPAVPVQGGQRHRLVQLRSAGSADRGALGNAREAEDG